MRATRYTCNIRPTAMYSVCLLETGFTLLSSISAQQLSFQARLQPAAPPVPLKTAHGQSASVQFRLCVLRQQLPTADSQRIELQKELFSYQST